MARPTIAELEGYFKSRNVPKIGSCVGNAVVSGYAITEADNLPALLFRFNGSLSAISLQDWHNGILMLDPLNDIRPFEVPSLWRHYKGTVYKVLNFVDYDNEDYVVYTEGQESANFYWLRSVACWNELVDGKPRFTLI